MFLITANPQLPSTMKTPESHQLLKDVRMSTAFTTTRLTFMQTLGFHPILLLPPLGVLAFKKLLVLSPRYVLQTYSLVDKAYIRKKIPDNIALGSDECLKRCNITRGEQPTKQRQPRVSANALPSGFSGPTSASTTTPTSSPAAPSQSKNAHRRSVRFN